MLPLCGAGEADGSEGELCVWVVCVSVAFRVGEEVFLLDFYAGVTARNFLLGDSPFDALGVLCVHVRCGGFVGRNRQMQESTHLCLETDRVFAGFRPRRL